MRRAVRKLMTLMKTNKGRHLKSIVSNMESEGMTPTKSFAHLVHNKCSDMTDGAAVEEASQASSRGAEHRRHPGRTISDFASSI